MRRQRQPGMKHLLGLAYVAIALAVCQAQLVNPDQLESTTPETEGQAQSSQDASTPQPHLAPAEAVLPPRWQNYVINLISNGITKLSLDLDRSLDNVKTPIYKNVLFSPVSVTVTLAMVLLASAGKTFEEISKLLGLETGVGISNHSETVHQVFGNMIQQFNQEHLLNKQAPQCEVAFGLFIQDGYPIREEFQAVSDKVYKSNVTRVDYAHNNEEAMSTINNWADEKTKGKIKQLLTLGPDPGTTFMIASALYFKGEWNMLIDKEKTKRMEFYVEPNKAVYADFMYHEGIYPFRDNHDIGFRIIGLPYKGQNVMMYVILPTAEGADALKEVKRRLTPQVIDSFTNVMEKLSCRLYFPRMQLSSNLDLRSDLESLGLQSLFHKDTADLSILSPGLENTNNVSDVPTSKSRRSSGLGSPDDLLQQQTAHPSSNHTVERQTPSSAEREFLDFVESQQPPLFGVDALRNGAGLRNPGLFADAVIHKVKMTVNEKGSEAAAVTATLQPRNNRISCFTANRPFLFFIRHKLTKLIWFWGSINRPEPFYDNL